MFDAPTRGRFGRALWLALCLTCAALPGTAGESADLTRGLKVAYLYNFTRFVEWPRQAAEVPFVIAVIGDDPLAAALRQLEREGRRVGTAPIRIVQADAVAQIGDARILFVGAAAAARLPAILEAVADRPVLLVGDSPGFVGHGVAINFFLKPDILGEGERLRFAIDPRALQGRSLKVSSRLYDVAELVR